MSYKWTSASTAEGRERLKELVLSGETIVVRDKFGVFGLRKYNKDHPAGLVCHQGSGRGVRTFETIINTGMNLEFLDPEPPKPQPDENGLLQIIQQWCHKAYNHAGDNWQKTYCQEEFMNWWRSNIDLIGDDLNRREGGEK